MEGPRKRAASWRDRVREQPHGGAEEESSLMEGPRKRAASWRGRGREQPHGGAEEESSLMEGSRKRAASWRGRGAEQPHGGNGCGYRRSGRGLSIRSSSHLLQ